MPIPTRRPVNHRGLRVLLIAAGCVSTALAVLGIFLPLLPTVPLLLLAAACFARGSQRCYDWLLEHRHLGPMVRVYLDGRGIPRRAKWTAIGLVWLSIPLTIFLISAPVAMKVALLAIGLGITLYLLRLPTDSPCEKNPPG
ncbi:MAG: YbaN family protein [Desulfuromonadales bacterium]|nr:YbaN family protein [Desulfuromonadales bacterium]